MNLDYLHIDWEKFHFLRPELLWILVPLIVVFLLGLFSFKNEEKWKKVIAPHLREYVIEKGSNTIRLWMHLLLFILLGLACVGLAGPTWKEIEVPGKILETPVVIALDLSQSMMAEDIQPNRLERAKFKIKDLIKANPRARMALVGFSGTAHSIVPLCSDYHIIDSHLDGLTPKIMPYSGTDFSRMTTLVDTIVSVSSAPSNLLLFTDEITESLFEQLKMYVQKERKKVVLIPMNTSLGSTIPKQWSKGVFKDKKGEPITSRLDQQILQKITSLDNVKVSNLTLDNSDMVSLAKEISENVKFQEKDGLKENEWEDQGRLLVVPLALFLVLWFRKGFVIYSVIGVLFLSSCSDNLKFKDLFYSKDYQGQQEFDKQHYLKAAHLYEDEMRKGVAYYKAGDYEKAIQSFSKDSTAQGAYNLGLSYYKNGDLAAAQMAFGLAVELDPSMDKAAEIQTHISRNLGGESEVNPEEAQEASEKQTAQNTENNSPEDLSGGGQKATKKDMEKTRLEETVNTDVRKGKELTEVPDDMGPISSNPQKIMMRKVNDDPALFLKRKFANEVKKKGIKPNPNLNKW
ncbi:MAG: VWA domain-containing protein [Salibacteraceae bacterium]